MRKLLKKIIYFINDFRNSKNFKKNYGSFKGIYNNFNEARKNSPRSNVGYNNDESVERLMYRCEELKCKIQEPEYPLFFYLNRILNKNKQVNIIDLGGGHLECTTLNI